MLYQLSYTPKSQSGGSLAVRLGQRKAENLRPLRCGREGKPALFREGEAAAGRRFSPFPDQAAARFRSWASIAFAEEAETGLEKI